MNWKQRKRREHLLYQARAAVLAARLMEAYLEARTIAEGAVADSLEAEEVIQDLEEVIQDLEALLELHRETADRAEATAAALQARVQELEAELELALDSFSAYVRAENAGQ